MEKKMIGFSIASLALGVISLCGWVLPCLGIPLTIAGIVLGIIGIKKNALKPMAIVGIILNALMLIAGLVNAIFGAVIGASGALTSISEILG